MSGRELCESRGDRPNGLCGRKATLNLNFGLASPVSNGYPETAGPPL